MRQPDPTPGAEPERGFLLAVLQRGVDADEELGELRELARTAGVEPVAEMVQQRGQPDRRTYVGKGKLDELKSLVREKDASLIIFDDELSPSQGNNVEQFWVALIRLCPRIKQVRDSVPERRIGRIGHVGDM